MGDPLELLLAGAVVSLLLLLGATVASPWPRERLDQGYVVFRHSTLEELPPEHVPVEDAVTSEVCCALAQGEYTSLRIGIHALADDLREVRLDLESDLSARVYRQLDTETREVLLGYENPVPDWLLPACLDESCEIA